MRNLLRELFPIPRHLETEALHHALDYEAGQRHSQCHAISVFPGPTVLTQLAAKTFTGVISKAKEGKFQRSTLPPHLPNWPGRQYTNLLRIPQVSLLVPGEGRRFCPVL
jgi:hypothetical protein